MRFALIRLAAERHRLLISNHHLLMDGWSAPMLVRELLAAYAAGGSVASLPRVTPYRDYLSFIAGQDRAAALAAWRRGAGRAGGGHAACAARLVPTARRRLRPSRSSCRWMPALSAALAASAREHARDAEHA